MATIGTFTKKDESYQGTITTLTLKAKVNITPVSRDNDKAPDFRVYAGSAEIGAAWSTTAKSGNAYLSPNFRTVAQMTVPKPQKTAEYRNHRRFVVLKVAALLTGFSS
jgi:uncharacterized protein (DUF736 family)